MRKSIYIIIYLIIAATIVYSGVFYLNRKELVECVCFKKYDFVPRKGGNKYFYMILDSSKESFTLNVSPKTYYSIEEGNKVFFNLRPTDYKKGPLVIFIQISFFIAGIIVAIIFFIFINVVVKILNYY